MSRIYYSTETPKVERRVRVAPVSGKQAVGTAGIGGLNYGGLLIKHGKLIRGGWVDAEFNVLKHLPCAPIGYFLHNQPHELFNGTITVNYLNDKVVRRSGKEGTLKFIEHLYGGVTRTTEYTGLGRNHFKLTIDRLPLEYDNGVIRFANRTYDVDSFQGNDSLHSAILYSILLGFKSELANNPYCIEQYVMFAQKFAPKDAYLGDVAKNYLASIPFRGYTDINKYDYLAGMLVGRLGTAYHYELDAHGCLKSYTFFKIESNNTVSIYSFGNRVCSVDLYADFGEIVLYTRETGKRAQKLTFGTELRGTRWHSDDAPASVYEKGLKAPLLSLLNQEVK